MNLLWGYGCEWEQNIFTTRNICLTLPLHLQQASANFVEPRGCVFFSLAPGTAPLLDPKHI
jgi:hypothetical protein